MTATLRFIGVINAAIWFGSAIFFSFVSGPAIFSAPMKALLGGAFPVYSGAIAQIIIERYFILQHVCGAIALLHLFGEWLYTGRPLNRVLAWLLSGIFCLGLLGGLGMQPHMKRLHLVKYGGAKGAGRGIVPFVACGFANREFAHGGRVALLRMANCKPRARRAFYAGNQIQKLTNIRFCRTSR